ncbi:unnamed protein product [Protopolystoma xenopodis]|uniref:Uncharacterized protein n=1 Tax=Protopolystoma xenopodis TaxID=117903 RepID=A0A448X2F3_9PLAT|nr:unnamed protein product [Protopolystoma xenopodis]
MSNPVSASCASIGHFPSSSPPPITRPFDSTARRLHTALPSLGPDQAGSRVNSRSRTSRATKEIESHPAPARPLSSAPLLSPLGPDARASPTGPGPLAYTNLALSSSSSSPCFSSLSSTSVCSDKSLESTPSIPTCSLPSSSGLLSPAAAVAATAALVASGTHPLTAAHSLALLHSSANAARGLTAASLLSGLGKALRFF